MVGESVVRPVSVVLVVYAHVGAYGCSDGGSGGRIRCEKHEEEPRNTKRCIRYGLSFG